MWDLADNPTTKETDADTKVKRNSLPQFRKDKKTGTSFLVIQFDPCKGNEIKTKSCLPINYG